MRYRNLVVLGLVLVLTTAALAGPRMHRSPTAPKLFKARTPLAAKPKATASAAPAPVKSEATDTAVLNESAPIETTPVVEMQPSAPANQ